MLPSCSAMRCCSTRSESCCQDIRRTRFSSCKCSAARVATSIGCSCGCVTDRRRRWLDYAWKTEPQAGQHIGCCNTPKTFRPWSVNSPCTRNVRPRCCDVAQKFHRCPPNPHRRCPCIDSGHDIHFFCNATDQNNLVARIAAIRYKIRKSVKWLVINLASLFIICLDDDFPTVVHGTLATINFLNICYYVYNLVKLYAALLRVKLERPAYWTKNCLWEKNLPQDLTRYFEVKGDEFFCRYWLYFSHLVSKLKTLRLSSLGRSQTEMGMERELEALGKSVWMSHCAVKDETKIEDARYRAPFMKRLKHPICTPEQLDKYWKSYDEACKDERVRLSKEQDPFQSGTQCKSSLEDQEQNVIKNVYHEVVVPAVLRRSEYQQSCAYDVHPSPSVASGKFSDFMQIHHSKDYCNSLSWIANMKFWLSNKLKELVEQFDSANRLLEHGGCNVRIGVSRIADLQIAFRQNKELLTFIPLLEFLSLTHNQIYLVWRYRVLASQPCLTSYSWQSGGDPRGNWGPESGPCDSEIVLHFFCTYMDMKLPDLPFHPAKKRPFTDQYVTFSDKPQQSLVDIAIVRQWASPPHFNVFVKGRVFAIQGGSNNLFLALSYVIYCIKIYQRGKIGRVSLGRTGLDMLWIVGDAT